MRSEQAPFIKEKQAKNTEVPEDQEVKKDLSFQSLCINLGELTLDSSKINK